MRIYEGYGTGHPVYTIKGNQIYQGYGTGHPIYTLKGDQVYQGYGTGHPVYTIKALYVSGHVQCDACNRMPYR